MLCSFCQENVRGTPCQTASQASHCPNNRDNDWPDDDRIDSILRETEDTIQD